MADSLPGVRLYLEYTTLPIQIVRPLQACAVGPAAQLVRYAEADERVLGSLGALDPLADAVHTYPNLVAGGVIDQDYVKLFAKDARVRYFEDLVGTDELVTQVSGKPDRVQIAGGVGFKANGSSYPRLAGLGDRDVQVGDKVNLRAVIASVEYKHATYVKALEAEQVAAVTSAAAADAANGPTQSAASTVTKLDAATTTNTLTAVLSGYDAWADGVLDETYTVEVIAGSVGGLLESARLRVTSASGLDDDLDVASGAVDSDFTVGARGLKLHWASSGGVDSVSSGSDLTVGEKWQVVVHDDYKAVTGTSAGTYTGAKDTTYLVEVTRGGTFAGSSKPQITCTTIHGTDASGPSTVTATATAVAVGTKGVTIAFSGSGVTGLRKGDRWSIPVTAAKDGAFTIIRLGNSLPEDMQDASDYDLELSVRRDLQVPERREGSEPDVNYAVEATQVSVPAGMVVRLDGFTDGGDPVDLDVVEASLYVEYRAWDPTLVTSGVDGIGPDDDIDLFIPGPLAMDNPLKWAVAKMRENTGATVWYSAVADPNDLDAWSDALVQTEGHEAIYSLFPVSTDPAVYDLVIAHCAAQSGPESGRFRVAWLLLTADPAKAIVSDATSSDLTTVLATFADDPETAGTQYTLVNVPAGNADFAVNGVRVGDVARAGYTTSWGEESYSSYPVADVLNEDTIKVVGGPAAAVSVAARLEIWRTLQKGELVDELKSVKSRSASELVRWVWPAWTVGARPSQADSFLPGSLAALRSGVAPHQGLTNLPVSGYAGGRSRLSNAQLDELAGAGVWVMALTNNGEVVSRHALTANPADLKHSEEMFQSNVHSVATQLRDAAAPFIGRTNVTASAAVMLRNQLESAIDGIMHASYVAPLGSQLKDGSTVKEVRESTVDGATFEVFFDLLLPLPNNHTNLHLSI